MAVIWGGGEDDSEAVFWSGSLSRVAAALAWEFCSAAFSTLTQRHCLEVYGNYEQLSYLPHVSIPYLRYVVMRPSL